MTRESVEHRSDSRPRVRALAGRLLVAASLVLAGCSRERLVQGLYACSEWRTDVEAGDWHGIAIGAERRAVLHRLRELGFGEVSAGAGPVRAHSAAELERVGALPRTSSWKVFAGDSGPPALIAWFEADGATVRRIEVFQGDGWSGSLIGLRQRAELGAQLRPLLDARIVSSVESEQRIYRASAAEPEESALRGLASDPVWQTGRELWWGHQALELRFEGDRLERIAIARVLFLR
jgi:hypothetical protein